MWLVIDEIWLVISGRIRALYTVSRALVGRKAVTLLNNPIRWLIFVDILFKWSDQVRFSEKVIPKYLIVRSRVG